MKCDEQSEAVVVGADVLPSLTRLLQAEGAHPRREVSQAQCREGSLRDVPSTSHSDGEDRYTVMKSNKDSLPREPRRRRVARYLREWAQRQGRIISGQMLRGASYSLGSGAVSLLLLWFEARH